MRRPLPLTLLTAIFAASALASASAQTLGLRSGITPEAAEKPAVVAEPEEEVAPPPLRRAIDDDPYEALGIRAGSFILYPSLTATTGYTTNAAGAAGGTGSGFGRLEPEVFIQSDWARHEATLKLRGNYEKFFDGASADKPSGEIDATVRVDLANEWTADLAASATYDQQNISDPGFPAGADTPPGVIGLSSSAALNGSFGRATFTVEGSADRSIYENATSGGVPVDQGDRTNTVFGGRLRLGYEATASLTPFVEGEIYRRAYDRPIDLGGKQRSSLGLSGRAGVAFDRGPLLKGEIAVGATQEDFDDATLATISVLTVDGSLVWAPTELISVTLDASTALNPSTDVASAGSVVYDGSVGIDYAWRRNFTIGWTAGINHERFQGTNSIDTTYRAGVGATWKINRSLHLTAGYLHEWLASSDPTTDYQSGFGRGRPAPAALTRATGREGRGLRRRTRRPDRRGQGRTRRSRPGTPASSRNRTCAR